MAVNYGLLEPVNIAGNMMAGRQQAQQNQLAQQQAEMRQQEFGMRKQEFDAQAEMRQQEFGMRKQEFDAQAEMRQQEFGMRKQEFDAQAEDRQLKLADYKTKQEGLNKFIQLSTANGKTGSPREMAASFYEYAITQRDPQLIMSAQTMMQAADEREKYQTYLKSQQTIPAQQAPAPMAGGLGTGTFGMDNIPGMPNALASRAATPMNALATQTADPVAALESRIAELESINDPRAQAEATRLRKQIDQYNQPFAVGGNLVTGGGRILFTAPEKPAAPPVSIAEYERAKTDPKFMRFLQERAAAQRAPATPATPAAPVAVVDPATGKQVYVTREQALSGRMTPASAPPVAVVDPVTGKQIYVTRDQSFGMTPASAMEGLTPKEKQNREAKYPQAKQATTTVSATMNEIDATIQRLLANEKGLNGITGLVYGNTMALTDAARKAQADLKQLKNLAFVQGLTELRNASSTGAGVGNVSNKEGDRFENLKASLEQSQSTQDLKDSLTRLRSQANATSETIKQAFEDTYSYRDNVAAPSATPAAGGLNVVVTPDGQSHTFPTPAAAAQFKKAAGIQ